MLRAIHSIGGSLSEVDIGSVGFSRREERDVCSSMDLARRRLTPDVTSYLLLVKA